MDLLCFVGYSFMLLFGGLLLGVGRIYELKLQNDELQDIRQVLNENLNYEVKKSETWKKAIFQYSIDTEDNELLKRIEIYFDDYMYRGIK